MFFFFRKPSIEIIAFISEEDSLAFENTPIKPARDTFPLWWKNVESSKFDWHTLNTKNTVKGCPGIINSLTAGFIMPIWCDLALKYNKEMYRYVFSDKQSSIVEHDGDQQAPGFYSNHFVTKIETPWIFQSPVDLHYSVPIYHHPVPLPFTIPAGIVKPIRKLCPANIFMFLPRQEHTTEILIKHNTPIYHILPITEKNSIIKHELLSRVEWARLEKKYGNGAHFTLKGLKMYHKDKHG